MTINGRWPDAIVERLTALWAEGLTAREIGEIISRESGAYFSRNAVIGRVHRMGLPPRSIAERTYAARKATPWAKRKHRPSEKSPRKRKPKLSTQPLPKEIVCPEAKMISILDLTDKTCRWPIGHPREEGFGFCGVEKPVDGTPYCEFHNHIAQAPQRRSGWDDERRAAQRRRNAERGVQWGFHGPQKAEELV